MPPTTLSEGDRHGLHDRAARSLSTEPRPFVRWAGSKRGLLSHLVPHLPTRYGSYYEPFLGSGALFFLLQPARAVLNDRCRELVDTYTAIRQDAGTVADSALAIPFNKDAYYAVRGKRSSTPLVRAGEFLYLNRGCFNGLYRVNSNGDFNVPWGAPKTSFVVDKSNLISCQDALRGDRIRLLSVDFEEALKGCRRNDLIFLDPPYVTRHNNNGFIDYNEKLFSWQDQIRLAEVAEKLRLRGCHVMVTNALHADVLALYPHFTPHTIERRSTLAGSSKKRGKVSEALLVGRSD